MTKAKAQLVKRGNSLAVRIPKNVPEQANQQEGEELKVRVEDGHMAPTAERSALAGGDDWGKPVGQEGWWTSTWLGEIRS
jgi:hypothetical protein